MTDRSGVHDNAPKRVPRGVRMASDLWQFVDGMADATGDGNASALIERWVREKRDAVAKAA